MALGSRRGDKAETGLYPVRQGKATQNIGFAARLARGWHQYGWRGLCFG